MSTTPIRTFAGLKDRDPRSGTRMNFGRVRNEDIRPIFSRDSFVPQSVKCKLAIPQCEHPLLWTSSIVNILTYQARILLCSPSTPPLIRLPFDDDADTVQSHAQVAFALSPKRSSTCFHVLCHMTPTSGRRGGGVRNFCFSCMADIPKTE